jgi:hypothetical protein
MRDTWFRGCGPVGWSNRRTVIVGLILRGRFLSARPCKADIPHIFLLPPKFLIPSSPKSPVLIISRGLDPPTETSPSWDALCSKFTMKLITVALCACQVLVAFALVIPSASTTSKTSTTSTTSTTSIASTTSTSSRSTLTAGSTSIQKSLLPTLMTPIPTLSLLDGIASTRIYLPPPPTTLVPIPSLPAAIGSQQSFVTAVVSSRLAGRAWTDTIVPKLPFQLGVPGQPTVTMPLPDRVAPLKSFRRGTPGISIPSLALFSISVERRLIMILHSHVQRD